MSRTDGDGREPDDDAGADEPDWNSSDDDPDDGDRDDSIPSDFEEEEQDDDESVEIPPMERPYVSWADEDAFVGDVPKAELLPISHIKILARNFLRRSRRLTPDIAQETLSRNRGVLEVLNAGELVAKPSDFPQDPGTYLILVAPPGSKPRQTWIPLYYGKAGDHARALTPRIQDSRLKAYQGLPYHVREEGQQGLRQRMKAYLHPELGIFGTAPKEAFKFYAFRNIQARGFSAQVRYQVCPKSCGLEDNILASVDLPLNKVGKQRRQYRPPDIPTLERAKSGYMWRLKDLASFPVVKRLPVYMSKPLKPASYYQLPDLDDEAESSASHDTSTAVMARSSHDSVSAATSDVTHQVQANTRPSSSHTVTATTGSRPPHSNSVSTPPALEVHNDLIKLQQRLRGSTGVGIPVAQRREVLKMLRSLVKSNAPHGLTASDVETLNVVLDNSTYIHRHQRDVAANVVEQWRKHLLKQQEQQRGDKQSIKEEKEAVLEDAKLSETTTEALVAQLNTTQQIALSAMMGPSQHLTAEDLDQVLEVLRRLRQGQ